MKVTVLGGSGFLGSHVSDRLTELGHEVLIFDLKPSLWLQPGQQITIGDILDEKALSEAIQGSDAVYNFAGIADLDEALQRPVDTARHNVVGNAMALEACRHAGVGRYMYASTVYVFSNSGGFYRCSKRAAEQYIEAYHEAYGVDYTILRYGSLYGPRSDSRNGLYRIVRRALEENLISYDGSPETMREYIHVLDAARCSVDMLQDEYVNQHVVLAGQEPMRVYDLLKMLAEMLHLEDAVEFRDVAVEGHYVRTPYSFTPKTGKKYVLPYHVDLGQGLLQLIEDIHHDLQRKASA